MGIDGPIDALTFPSFLGDAWGVGWGAQGDLPFCGKPCMFWNCFCWPHAVMLPSPAHMSDGKHSKKSLSVVGSRSSRSWCTRSLITSLSFVSKISCNFFIYAFNNCMLAGVHTQKRVFLLSSILYAS